MSTYNTFSHIYPNNRNATSPITNTPIWMSRFSEKDSNRNGPPPVPENVNRPSWTPPISTNANTEQDDKLRVIEENLNIYKNYIFNLQQQMTLLERKLNIYQNTLIEKFEQLETSSSSSSCKLVYMGENCYGLIDYNINKIKHLVGRKGAMLAHYRKNYDIIVHLPSRKQQKDNMPIKIFYDKCTSKVRGVIEEIRQILEQ